jgi:glycine/D-amino acid oxidase-like deaminating enzyme
MDMKTDVLIVGGAAMGAATAYHLVRLDPGLDVVVVERDSSYARSSTLLSDGNVRIQFNLEENIRISQFALEVLERFADEMAVGSFRPDPLARHQGNLFLADAAGRAAAEAGMAKQRSLGCEVEWFDHDEIGARWPVFAGPGYVGGAVGAPAGAGGPRAGGAGYRRKAIALGAVFREASVAALSRRDAAVDGIVLDDGERITADTVVVCAGAWSPGLLDPIGVHLPVLPVMRNVFVVATPLGTDGTLPSVFLPSGLYVLPEHEGTFLIAWSQDDDPVGFDFTVRRQRFYDLIWPELVEQFPAFDQLEVARSWAGLYAVNTLDGNAIIGPFPGVEGLVVCTGFSGHGFQQCHAVGRYLAERILGLDPALDLGRFGPERVIRGEPLFEHAGRII